MTDRYLKGRIAWVTGGGSGMGRETALALARAGADVAIGSLTPELRPQTHPNQNAHRPTDQDLARVRDELEALGSRALALPLDVRSDASVRSFFNSTIARFGKVDILINAAGTGARSYMVGHSDELWHDVINTNLNGPYRTTKLCLPGMIERRWGRIVNIASTAARRGADFAHAYCSSKSGLLGLTRCVALEGAPHGVSCNAVSPGSVDTPNSRVAMAHRGVIDGTHMTLEERHARVREECPQKRLIEAGEIAALATFLCRDEAFGITGEDILVAGGSSW